MSTRTKPGDALGGKFPVRLGQPRGTFEAPSPSTGGSRADRLATYRRLKQRERDLEAGALPEPGPAEVVDDGALLDGGEA